MMSHYGRAWVAPDGDWWIVAGASGTGGLAALEDYARRALSGRLDNMTTDERGTFADVLALDWSVAP